MVIAEKQGRLNIGHLGAEFSGANAKKVKMLLIVPPWSKNCRKSRKAMLNRWFNPRSVEL
jgi:hypothetical protein